MKKFLVLILALALIAFPLSGCNGGYKSKPLEGTQDKDYVVYNNGSSAVQYGNYLYFINGYRGFEDTDAKNNVMGEVTKGGLYRVELNGVKSGREFDLQSSVVGSGVDTYDTGLGFKNYSAYVTDSNDEKRLLNDGSDDLLVQLNKENLLTLTVTKTETDEDGNEYKEDVEEKFTLDNLKYDVTKVDKLAGKTIGTSGYKKAGVFIYDDFCYYASPNNERNKVGTVQTTLTDFFATKLDGSVTRKIYTTKSDSTSSPYAFYKRGDSVYLTVLDGSDVISVRIKDGKRKDVNKIAENITGAVMPVNRIYDSTALQPDTDVTQYIFTTRSSSVDDRNTNDTIIEYMRPDGSFRHEFMRSGKTCSIEDVVDGIVFYRSTDEFGTTSLRYTNLPEVSGTAEFSGELLADATTYSSYYFFRDFGSYEGNAQNKDIFALGQSSNGIFLINGGESLKISNTSATVIGIYDNMVYFYTSTSLMRCALATPAEDNTDETVSDATNSGFIPAVGKGYVVFLKAYNEDVSDYTHVYFTEGGSTQFVGEIASFDLPKDDDEAEQEETPEA